MAERTAEILLGGESFSADDMSPFVFGRCHNDRIVGLDPNDMGISAESGCVQFELGLWWIINRSRKRPLFLELDPGSHQMRIEAGDRTPLTRADTVVLVPGAIYTHKIEVHLPPEYVSTLRVSMASTSGTITAAEVALSDRDRDALSALFCGYLRPFPYRDPRPASYQEAADLLGSPWTKVTVRKQIERIKERFARSGLYFQGVRANDELAEHLISTGIMSELTLTSPEGGR